mmetsp:Transcript_17360/g.25684  ORF Transcript_17360/g.25684 Transcript_17360/m.25684 type:complete len:91 (-) Transcript_17360:526-798(-)
MTWTCLRGRSFGRIRGLSSNVMVLPSILTPRTVLLLVASPSHGLPPSGLDGRRLAQKPIKLDWKGDKEKMGAIQAVEHWFGNTQAKSSKS